MHRQVNLHSCEHKHTGMNKQTLKHWDTNTHTWQKMHTHGYACTCTHIQAHAQSTHTLPVTHSDAKSLALAHKSATHQESRLLCLLSGHRMYPELLTLIFFP